MAYHRRTMLIWARTYPELSQQYTETVCTGALFIDGERPEMCRLYPMDTRYLPEEKRARRWDIISAEVERNSAKDPRPESYKIRAGSIQILRRLGTGDRWRERRNLMLQDHFMVDGVEDMVAKQSETRQSFGVIRNSVVARAYVADMTQEQIESERAKYNATLLKRKLWPDGGKPVPPLETKPRFSFKADGDSRTYDRLCLDWEVVEAMKRVRKESKQNVDQRFHEFMVNTALKAGSDCYLILGNIARHQHTFIIVGVFYPPKPGNQGALF